MISRAAVLFVVAILFAGIARAEDAWHPHPNPDGPAGTWFMDMGGGFSLTGDRSFELDREFQVDRDISGPELSASRFAAGLGVVASRSTTLQFGIEYSRGTSAVSLDTDRLTAKDTLVMFGAKLRVYFLPKKPN